MYWTVVTCLYQFACSLRGTNYYQHPPSSDLYYVLHNSETSRHSRTEVKYLVVDWIPHICSWHTVYLVTLFRLQFRIVSHMWELEKDWERSICVLFEYHIPDFAYRNWGKSQTLAHTVNQDDSESLFLSNDSLVITVKYVRFRKSVPTFICSCVTRTSDFT